MRTIPRTRLLVAATVAAGLLLVGCSSDDPSSPTTTAEAATTSAAPTSTGAVTVSAAASLTEAFTAIKDGFTAANPDATVTTNFGSSGQLATQIQGGAPADVAAFADETAMSNLADAGLLAAPPKVFARNQLVIVTKPGNPEKVTSLADLATVGTVALCAETAPCGKFAGQALKNTGVAIPTTSVTRGPDVKATLAAVTEGDAEAAVVYLTDAKAAGAKVASVEIPEAQNVVTSYPIAVVKAAANPTAAQAFEDFVLGPKGRAALQDAGFLAP